MKLYCYSKTTINIVNNPMQHDRTKHVKIDILLKKNWKVD